MRRSKVVLPQPEGPSAAGHLQIDPVENGRGAEALREARDSDMRGGVINQSLFQRSTQPPRCLAKNAQSGANSEAGSG